MVKVVNFPKVCSNFSIVRNYHFHKGGRIWLVWLGSSFVVNMCGSSAQHIHCEVLHKTPGDNFAVTIVYGYNDVGAKDDL